MRLASRDDGRTWYWHYCLPWSGDTALGTELENGAYVIYLVNLTYALRPDPSRAILWSRRGWLGVRWRRVSLNWPFPPDVQHHASKATKLFRPRYQEAKAAIQQREWDAAEQLLEEPPTPPLPPPSAEELAQKTSQFWQAAERASAEVARWPAWKRAGYAAGMRGRPDPSEQIQWLQDKEDG